jgi:thiol-disulfide isomerase/thioredoxin
MNKTITFLAAALVLLSCGSAPKQGPMTRFSGVFPDGPIPDSVEIQYWIPTDTILLVKTKMIPVVDRRFEGEIPSCVTQFAEVFVPGDIVKFIADGTTLTIDIETHQVSSSDPEGVQSRYNAWYQEWIDLEHETVSKNYALKDRAEAGEDIRDETQALEEEYHQKLVAIHRNAIRQNPDNIVGAFALSALESSDPKVALSLVGTLSEEMTKNATVQALLPTLEARARTAIGDKFTDFEVMQNPSDPRSMVKLSDYVGKGKTILLVFWASWCEENRKEMPGLKSIYEKYHGDAFDMVSIAVSDAPENSLSAAKEMGITWNLIVNAQSIPLETYGVRRIPDMILFGPDGTILLRNFWGYDDQVLDAIIDRYIRGEHPIQPGVL